MPHSAVHRGCGPSAEQIRLTTGRFLGGGNHAQVSPARRGGNASAWGPHHEAEPHQERFGDLLDRLGLLGDADGKGRQAHRAAGEADAAVEILQRVAQDHPEDAGVRNNLANAVSAELVAHFGDKVFRTIIPRNVRVAEAPSHGQSIVGYDKGSRGAIAYLGLAGEVLRHQRERKQAKQAATTEQHA